MVDERCTPPADQQQTKLATDAENAQPKRSEPEHRAAIDMGTLKTDGLVSDQDAAEYLVYRKAIEMSQRFQRYDKPLLDVVIHCCQKINVFCIYLLVPDTISKMMKEWIKVPRALVKNITPLNSDLTKLTKTQKQIHSDAIDQLTAHCKMVFELVDNLLKRVDDGYKGLNEELFRKYELRYEMVRSSLLKIGGDFKRYYSEHQEQEEKLRYAELAKSDYEAAYNGFLKLPNGKKSPYSLSCMLNYSVLLCDVFGQVDEAIKVADKVSKEAGKIMDEEDLQDHVFVELIRLFSQNIAIWDKSIPKDDSDSDESEEEQKQKLSSPLQRSKTMNAPTGGV